MEDRELDVTAPQVVRWLRRELQGAPIPEFEVLATREYLALPLDRPEAHGVEADLDIEEFAAVGTLEVRPLPHSRGWVLRVRIEDEIGAHLPDDESAPDEPEEIDLDAFEADFVTPGTGDAFVSVEVENDAAAAQFEEVLADLVRNRHGA